MSYDRLVLAMRFQHLLRKGKASNENISLMMEVYRNVLEKVL
jgi:hypothetical protein